MDCIDSTVETRALFSHTSPFLRHLSLAMDSLNSALG